MFRVRNLPKATYQRLQKIVKDYDVTQRVVIVAGIEAFQNYIQTRGQEAGKKILDQAQDVVNQSDEAYNEYMKGKRAKQ